MKLFLSQPKRLSAGLFRQATYATSRLGFYSGFMEHFEPKSFLGKSLAGLAAGGLGAIIGTPADVALIRMTTDGRYNLVITSYIFLPLINIILKLNIINIYNKNKL